MLPEENFRAYINGFSNNVDDIIEHFADSQIRHRPAADHGDGDAPYC